MTVPNAKSGQRKPAGGWPAVIFQHGITRNRTDLFALADALSFVGFAAIAIDMPLHGVTDKTNPFYAKGLERTFDLDLVNNATGASGADGVIDPSGSYFINLQSLLTLSLIHIEMCIRDSHYIPGAGYRGLAPNPCSLWKRVRMMGL